MQKYKFLPYNKELILRAKELRKNQTEAEIKFWNEVLKNEKLKNFKFTTQKPIDNFIVDFYCSALGLIIEIDGNIHKFQKARDTERDNILKEKFGLRILRYTNEEVLNNAEFVLDDLIKRINTTHP
ncbi:MAG: DUF559 domain-containing protein [Candidatus Nomurabacteria bacterium]|nr:DUF559 domain-containing protein [Candidatus Nomurabacteria bacterium]